MPRPKRPRHIFSDPEVTSFRPDGQVAGSDIILSLEELEAIRIIDYTGMDQSRAAEIMNVSRQTVGRILKAGRIKVSTALIEGRCLKVEGGCYRIKGHGPHGRGQGGHGRGGMGRNQGSGFGQNRGPGQRHQP